MSKARKPKQPKEGSLAWERQLHKNPIYVKNTIYSLASRASQGNKEAVEALVGWLARHPEMREFIRQLDDLCATAEDAWVMSIAGTDLIRQKAIREEIAKMKTELLPEKSSIMHKVMVSNLIVSYLANQAAVLLAAKPADQLAVATARDRRAESTMRRLLLAVKCMDLIEEKMNRGVGPQAKLKLFSAVD